MSAHARIVVELVRTTGHPLWSLLPVAPSQVPTTMRVRLLSASLDGPNRHYALSYVVNDRIAIDAGTLAFHGLPQAQARIRDVLITHSHADHLASLPIFLENACVHGGPRIRVWGSRPVLECVQKDLFNDRVWPRIDRLSQAGVPPFDLVEIEAEHPIEIDGVRILPVELDHMVPTLGFLLESDAAGVLIVSDTGPTDRIWRAAAQAPGLAAVFLEASFPNSKRVLAEVSKHLTPALFAKETAKLGRSVEWIAVHIKARWHDETVRELLELGIERLAIGQSDREYVW